MGVERIFLKDALKTMSLRDKEGKPFPFDIAYRTFNKQTKKGGKMMRLKGVKLLPEANRTQEKITEESIFDNRDSKNPNHFQNRTRNIELSNNSIKTVRIDFITEINGKQVLL